MQYKTCLKLKELYLWQEIQDNIFSYIILRTDALQAFPESVLALGRNDGDCGDLQR